LLPPETDPHPKRSPLQGFLPFLWIALACLVGILVADYAQFPTWAWAAGFGLAALSLTLALTLPKSLPITHRLRRWTGAEQRLPRAALIAIALLGGWRMAATLPKITPDTVAYYNDRGTVQLLGVIVDAPDPRDTYTNLTVHVDQLRPLESAVTQIKPLEVEGKVLVQVPPGEDWAYGDRVQISGSLETPYDSADFSYREYLARKGIGSLMPYAAVSKLGSGSGSPIRAALYQLRERGYAALHQLFPSPESDLLAGILLGRDQGLSPQLEEAFQRTGTTHIIAISGFNIAILAGLFTGITNRLFGRIWGSVAALLGISGYTILVGADAAVVRAAIMGALGVFGGMFGRRQNGLNSLGMAAFGMMLHDPNILWDVGFQLSIAATLGLVLYAQPIEEWFLGVMLRKVPEETAQRLIGPISEFILFTIIAQVMTLPVMAYHFGGISWIALLANPLILPVQSLVMILGGLAMLGGLLLPGIGRLLAILAQPFVTYTIWLLIFYGQLFFLTLLPKPQQKSALQKVLKPQWGLLVVAGLVILTWSHALGAPDGALHLTLLDAEGSVLIQTPSGNAVLIGGGKRPSALKQSLGEMLPAGKAALDGLVVGSTYRDDLNALTGSLPEHPAELVLWSVEPEANQTTATVYSTLESLGADIRPMAAGQLLLLDEDVRLDVLWTGERGAVLWLTWDNFSALLPTGKVEGHWLTVPATPDVILLPDNLKAEDLPQNLLAAWQPAVLLLPLDEADLPLHGGHPLQACLEDYPLVTTVEHGWIRVSTDGKTLWVNGEY
jgi:competence protein ComEC